MYWVIDVQVVWRYCKNLKGRMQMIQETTALDHLTKVFFLLVTIQLIEPTIPGSGGTEWSRPAPTLRGVG